MYAGPENSINVIYRVQKGGMHASHANTAKLILKRSTEEHNSQKHCGIVPTMSSAVSDPNLWVSNPATMETMVCKTSENRNRA